MKMNKPKAIAAAGGGFLALLLLGLLALRGMSGAPVFRVVNRSGADIKGVQLRGHDWSRDLGGLAAGRSVEFAQAVKGESDFKIELETGKGKHGPYRGGYFEGTGGYCVTATIDEALKVKVETRVACFRLARLLGTGGR
jgi:hypothetical protein